MVNVTVGLLEVSHSCLVKAVDFSNTSKVLHEEKKKTTATNKKQDFKAVNFVQR
jgi:hypothetical protein